MAIEIAGIKLSKVHKIFTLEKSDFKRYRIPGLNGELAQDLGRQSVRLQIEGIFYGQTAMENLEQLRNLHKSKKPVEFIAEIIGLAYFAKVLLDRFEVTQQAKDQDQFSYILVVTEYLEPPQPVLLEKPNIDASVLSDARTFMDSVLLPDVLKLPEIKDPTTPMNSMLDSVKTIISPLDEESQTLTKIFGA